MHRRSHSPPRWWLWLGLWTLVGLTIRLITVYRDPNKVAGGDAYFYHYGANLLVSGHGFINPYLYIPHNAHHAVQSASFPPLFLFLVAIPSALGLKTFLAERVWCCVLGAAAIVVCGYTGREIGGLGGDPLGLFSVALETVIFGECDAGAAGGGKMVHDDEASAWPQDAPGLVERARRRRNDAHHVRGERHIEGCVGELEGLGIHHLQRLDLSEALALDARPRFAQHRGADVDAGDIEVGRKQREFESGADAHDKDVAPGPRRVGCDLRRRKTAGMKGQVKNQIVDRSPAAVGCLGMAPLVSLGGVHRLHCPGLRSPMGQSAPQS